MALSWTDVDSLTAIVESREHHPVACWALQLDSWRAEVEQVDWRPQLCSELRAIDQGHVPPSVGPTKWLLEAAIVLERCDLIAAILAKGTNPDNCVHLLENLGHRPEIIRMILDHVLDIEKGLSSLLYQEILIYTLPYLGGISHDVLRENCWFDDMEALHNALGVSFEDPAFILKALEQPSRIQLSSMRFLAKHAVRTKDVIRMARESIWYWVLFSTEEERQTLVDTAPALRDYILEWLDKGTCATLPKLEWTIAQLVQLIELPFGVIRSLMSYSRHNDVCREITFWHRRTHALREFLRDNYVLNGVWYETTFALPQ
jgi:hypothetical protein